MVWDVVVTVEFEQWWYALSDTQQNEIRGRVNLLETHGPGLGRPVVDTIAASRIPNLKELRARADGAALRVLFVFDPVRRAVLLLGGDKTGRWNDWYTDAIPRAERLYAGYLESPQYKREVDEHRQRGGGRG